MKFVSPSFTMSREVTSSALPLTMAFCKNLKISIGSMKSLSTDPSISLINAAGFTLNSCGDSLCPWLVH